MATASSTPRTVEEIFKDFTARRSALLRALTSGVYLFLSLEALLLLIMFVLLTFLLFLLQRSTSSTFSVIQVSSLCFTCCISD